MVKLDPFTPNPFGIRLVMNDSLSSTPKIPFGIKIALSLFMAVLIPVYTYNWGLSNFLWFCDVALIVMLIGVWKESPRLISMQAVAIVLPQSIWIVDFLAQAIFGEYINESTRYMFDADNSLFARFLSLFHFWMPILLLYLVWRIGFDRKAFAFQILLCWAVLIVSFVVLPYTDNTENINKIWGWEDAARQEVMAPVLWLGCLMLIYPVCVYLPTHLLLSWLAPTPQALAERRQPISEPTISEPK